MFGKKGQGATEYLVLLAVVLIIALVSIALLGFFPGLAGDARRTQSDAYWRGEARPFAIIEHKQSGTALNLVIENHEADRNTISIGGILLDGTTATITAPSAPINVSGGATVAVNVTAPASCAAGDVYTYDVVINYSSRLISGQRQTGTKPLIGKCS